MPTGKVEWFNDQKGFGFIAPDDGSERLFFHSSSIIGGYMVMVEGEAVAYDKQQSDKGPRAANVQKLSSAFCIRLVTSREASTRKQCTYSTRGLWNCSRKAG